MSDRTEKQMQVELEQLDLRYGALGARDRRGEARAVAAASQVPEGPAIVVVAEGERLVVVEGFERVRASLLLSARETARLFAISEGTVHRWEAELRLAQSADPSISAIREKLQPTPPVRRYADAVRSLVVTLSVNGFGGAEKIAQTMARLGYAISARTIGRIRRERTVPAPSSPTRMSTDAPSPGDTQTPARKASPRALSARGPLDKVHIDITHVTSLFGLIPFRIAVVLDLFSRFPLALAIYLKEPSASDVVALLEKALAFGTPRVLITDPGRAFRSDLIAAAVHALGIQHRFGALYRHGSIARLERMWRSLKTALGVRLLFRRLMPEDFERDVRLALLHYAFFRPHAALDGATPAEVFLRLPPVSPSRFRADWLANPFPSPSSSSRTSVHDSPSSAARRRRTEIPCGPAIAHQPLLAEPEDSISESGRHNRQGGAVSASVTPLTSIPAPGPPSARDRSRQPALNSHCGLTASHADQRAEPIVSFAQRKPDQSWRPFVDSRRRCEISSRSPLSIHDPPRRIPSSLPPSRLGPCETGISQAQGR